MASRIADVAKLSRCGRPRGSGCGRGPGAAPPRRLRLLEGAVIAERSAGHARRMISSVRRSARGFRHGTRAVNWSGRAPAHANSSGRGEQVGVAACPRSSADGGARRTGRPSRCGSAGCVRDHRHDHERVGATRTRAEVELGQATPRQAEVSPSVIISSISCSGRRRLPSAPRPDRRARMHRGPQMTARRPRIVPLRGSCRRASWAGPVRSFGVGHDST